MGQRHEGITGFAAGLIAVWISCCASPLASANDTADTLAAADSRLPRHALEIQALTDPAGVLRALPAVLEVAKERADGREVALLYLARANACRMTADWPCQRDAGSAARTYADAAAEPILAIRGLIAESRASIALQDYSRGEQALIESESRLRQSPSAELKADVALAYSSLSNMLGKHQLALEYADRGLAELEPRSAQGMRIRLLRNRARAAANLGDLAQARESLAQGLAMSADLIDPKLKAELHLETARVARADSDRALVRANAEQVQRIATDLQNTQLSGQAHELVGLAALDAGDLPEALTELRASVKSFNELGLMRDELRVLRSLVGAELQGAAPAAQWTPELERMLQLEARVSSRDRAEASDDFEARLEYAEQKLEVARLEKDAALALERAEAMARQHRLTGFLILLGIAIVLALAYFFHAQRRLNRQLRSALDARLRALTHTSHELRNPISGVIGLSELLLTSPLSPSQKNMVEAVQSAGHTIEKLAQDLLDRGRIESGQLELQLRPTSLVRMVSTVQQLYLPRAREKGLTLRLDLSPELPDAVMLDVERLQQVLSNLIGNSIKFTEKGEICLGVKLISEPQEVPARVRFSVRDSGPGIDADEIGSLFEPFARGRAGHRHRAGVGLGLAISSDLVRLMGGDIQAESTPGDGACFQFTLSLEPCAGTGIEAAVEGVRKEAGMTVLVVDDDEDVSLTLRSQLEVLGCRVEVANCSRDARSKVAVTHYDLLLLDVELPDGQGPDLAQTLRLSEPDLRRSRIAIVSGHQAPKVLPAGVDEWLSKPVRLERLNTLLAHAGAARVADRAA